jgi:cytoskeletal protein RodZ
MNIPPEDIDRLFRDETERLSEVSPDTAFDRDRFWQQLQTRLEPPKTVRRQLLWYRVAAGIVLVCITVLFSWKLYQQQRQLESYAMQLSQLKRVASITPVVGDLDTVSSAAIRQPEAHKAEARVQQSKKTEITPTAVLPPALPPPVVSPAATLVLADTSLEKLTQQPMPGSRKPFRIVPKNRLPYTFKQLPETQGMYVKAERQHSPKLTISLTPKSDQ